MSCISSMMELVVRQFVLVGNADHANGAIHANMLTEGNGVYFVYLYVKTCSIFGYGSQYFDCQVILNCTESSTGVSGENCIVARSLKVCQQILEKR